ncbi:hypothetical protein [Streptomyces sp. 4N124]|uniref:hypothetical protein n=1 Tax=Streptomyces sp. 4N124 TaxID=3457420 RepID=UPI003FD25B2B
MTAIKGAGVFVTGGSRGIGKMLDWVAERMLEWSGLPTVNIRAAMFVENPLMTWLALGPLSEGELRPPFGPHRLAPIAGYDVAVPVEVETWNETYIDSADALAAVPHTVERLKTLTRLMGGGGYRGVSDQLETLLGRPPKTVRWALRNHPLIQKPASA